jgi:SAM-dependent methyltransferase
MTPFVVPVLGVGLAAWMLTQCRKPNGPLGRRVLAAMNISHSRLTDWGLTHVHVGARDVVLDIGCGGGRTIQKLAVLASEGTVFGIDYSKASVAASRLTNADAIDEGRVHVDLASVAALPFADRTFDVITAVETHYYWPDLSANLAEVLRVLKPGGQLTIIAEAYRGGALGGATSAVMKVLRGKLLTPEEHQQLLVHAGFANVQIHLEPSRNWICATGRRMG